MSDHTRYFLRSGSRLCVPPTKTVTYGTRSLNFMGSLLWNRLPKNINLLKIKDSASIVEFKNRLKSLSKKFVTAKFVIIKLYTYFIVDFYKYYFVTFPIINS